MFAMGMPQRTLTPLQRLREHLEDALAEADSINRSLTALHICNALDSIDSAVDDVDTQPFGLRPS